MGAEKLGGMEAAGMKLVEYFNRHGDVEGQRLFYLYTVQVETLLKEKQILTVNRNPLPDHGKSKLDPDKRRISPKMLRIVEKHQSSESNARVSARRTLMMLRQMPVDMRREYANDDTLLVAWANGYKIGTEHWELYRNLVRQGVAEL